MTDFFEIDEKKKTVKTLNLDDFSIEDLFKYLEELKEEIQRVEEEVEAKNKIKSEAESLFK